MRDNVHTIAPDRRRGAELFSMPAEQSVLGAMMLAGGAFDAVCTVLRAESFYGRHHQIIYAAIAELAEENKPRDAVTVSEHMAIAGTLAEAGGLGYLAELVQETPAASAARHYAEIVRDRYHRRKLAELAINLQDGITGPDSVDQLIEAVHAQMCDLAIDDTTRNRSIHDILPDLVETLQQRFESDGLTGQPTGIKALDTNTCGLQPGELIVLAARPSMGKTTLAINIAQTIAAIGQPVQIFSLEQPSRQLVERMAANLGRINSQSLRQGTMLDSDWGRLNSAVAALIDTPIYIDDTPGATVMEIASKTREAIRAHGKLGLVVIDYLGLIAGGDSDNEALRLGQITKALKNLAREIDAPVLLLCQLNRDLEKRANPRPRPADLRASGAIEEDADTILFIYRESVYDPDYPDVTDAEIIIGKQRNGPLATVDARFYGEYYQFTDRYTEGANP